NNSVLNKDYFNDIKADARNWNFMFNFRNPILPTSFEYSSGLNLEDYGNREINVKENRYLVISRWGSYNSFSGKLKINYNDLNRVELNNYSQNHYNTQVQFLSQIPFNSPNNKTAKFSYFYSNNSGTNPFLTANWTSSYQTMKNNLKTELKHAYYLYKNSGNHSLTNNLLFTVNHKLYLSLITDVSIDSKIIKEIDFKQRLTKIDFSWDYMKLLPQGQLFGQLGINQNWDNINSKEGAIRRGEFQHQFSSQNPVIIPYQGIVDGSIEIQSLDGFSHFVPDLDYQVFIEDGLYIIQRLPGSAIPESEIVAIQFMHQGEPSQNIRYTFWNYGLSYRLQKYFIFEIGYKGKSSVYPEQSLSSWWQIDEKKIHSWFIHVDYRPIVADLSWEESTSVIIPYTTTSFSITSVFGTYISQYLLINLQFSRQSLTDLDDIIRQQYIQVEYFRRFGRDFRGKVSWNQRSVHGKINDLVERKWEIVIKHDTGIISTVFEYEYVELSFFDDLETNQNYKLSVNIKPWF
ncbi:MAG: hypothetical protein ACE5D7_07670, partial [Fidelibacterota bacterium]